MNEERFWDIIRIVGDKAAGDMDEKCRYLKNEVSGLNAVDTVAFRRIFDELMDNAYSWSLWGASYVINGGCGDDSFIDFRSSLISQGREAYEKALANPDSLSEIELVDEEDWCYEGFQYAVAESVEAVAGKVPDTGISPAEPQGVEWQDDELNDLYPRLSAKYA